MDQFFGIGLWELLMIAVIALVVLGPRQMIRMSRKAGEYARQFRSLWEQWSVVLQKELGALDGTNVVHEVSQEIQGLKSEMQKSLQALQSEATTATTIAPPTTASPVIPSPPPPTNGEAATTPPDTNPTSSKPPTQPSYSAWIDKSTKN
jgi:sec-independent protein translocase protein TatB